MSVIIIHGTITIGKTYRYASKRDWDVEIRKLVCSTNAIGSINARIRRAVSARRHFPTEQAALKCVYMALTALDPTGTGPRPWPRRPPSRRL